MFGDTKRRLAVFLAVTAAIGIMTGCRGSQNVQSSARVDTSVKDTVKETEEETTKNSLYQVSTLNAVMQGYADSAMTSEAFLEYGDMGFGTLASTKGNMIVIDGRMYQIQADGSAAKASKEDGVSFGVITSIGEDAYTTDLTEMDMEGVMAELDGYIENHGKNRIYAAMIDGKFSQIQTQAGMAAPKTAEDEETAVQELEDSKGTIVAVWFPDYYSGLNTSGWHMYYLTSNRKTGGYAAGFTLNEAKVMISEVDGFSMMMPGDGDYQHLELSDQESESEIETETNMETE